MRSTSTPLVIAHPRTQAEIAGALEGLLETALGLPAGEDPLRDALVHIAARYGEIVTARVNAAPLRHLDAFADLLGGRPLSARAATVHLGFVPAPGDARNPPIVPMNTRVAAPPAGGDPAPVLFETLHDLALTRAEPRRAVLLDAGHRLWREDDGLLQPPGKAPPPAGEAVAVPYDLYLGHASLFATPGLREITVDVVIEPSAADDAAMSPAIEWRVPTAQGEVPAVISGDTTAGLAHSGSVVFVPPADWSVVDVRGTPSRWLIARRRLAPGAPARPVRVAGLGLRALATTATRPVTAACQDGVPLDVTKDVHPFGERPRFGAAFQMLSPVLAQPGTRVELRVRMTNPEGVEASPIPPVTRDGAPRVGWEISTATGFRNLRAEDGTEDLLHDGIVAFTVPDQAAPVTIAGKTGVWVRARLAAGHYGVLPPSDLMPVPTPRAPSIKSIAVSSTLVRGPVAAEHLVSQGALEWRRLDPLWPAARDAFVAPDIDGPALYLGLSAPPGALAAGRVLHWHVRPAPQGRAVVADGDATGAGALRWQVRTVRGWSDITVQDGSDGFTRSGLVSLRLAEDASPWAASLLDPLAGLAWLRVSRPAGEAPGWPLGLVINAVAAQQSQRLRDEVVGSSNGRASQSFRALRTPIVGPLGLQVRESEATWVAWEEVDDLLLAGVGERVFTVDRDSGRLQFGDGRHGRIPPRGANNIRLHDYTTGGGTRGNRPAGDVAQLLTTLPGVASVVSLEPSNGGVDADTPERVRAGAAAWLRHRDRAVCADDYVDLARRASPQVARAFCTAGRDLSIAPGSAAVDATASEAGVISLTVVPRSDEPTPQPEVALLALVKSFLEARRQPAGRLVVVGPTWARVDVHAQIEAVDGWSPHEVTLACRRQVERFLHPVHGGDEALGWRPRQRPHRSDFHALLAAVDGVALVRGLQVAIHETAGATDLVCAGRVDIDSGAST